MLILEVFITERWRDNLIIISIFLSLFTTLLSFLQICAGVCSISIYDAPLTALEKRAEQDLAYILIVSGLTGCLMHLLGMAVCWSQRFINKRTISHTRLMTLLTLIMILQIILEVASVVLNHKASMLPWAENGQRFQCCGNENFKDWLEIRWFPRDYSISKISKEAPFSCCRRDAQPPCEHDNVLLDLHRAYKGNDEGLLTINKNGCLEVFYQDYSNFIIYGVCIPCCFKIVMLFLLVPIFRYIDTSIYRAIKTGFPQNAEYGYLLAFYEPAPKPKKLTKTDQRVLSLMSLSSVEPTTSYSSKSSDKSPSFFPFSKKSSNNLANLPSMSGTNAKFESEKPASPTNIVVSKSGSSFLTGEMSSEKLAPIKDEVKSPADQSTLHSKPENKSFDKMEPGRKSLDKAKPGNQTISEDKNKSNERLNETVVKGSINKQLQKSSSISIGELKRGPANPEQMNRRFDPAVKT
ncbi:hypothetical protein HELRODRAFT_182534 [Helobdella robusta]|uniref:Tetraspanin n=1 Tax=Helobdella robusta TaxID=6412 RepID=T1FIB7_HELRO|nr:hypothetical protein HELRODRAFT_182534 [Helobdella robusta]ESN90825.1 hypothetical protein HELRODRAFT_182534 [Helobdella robusta]